MHHHRVEDSPPQENTAFQFTVMALLRIGGHLVVDVHLKCTDLYQEFVSQPVGQILPTGFLYPLQAKNGFYIFK